MVGRGGGCRMRGRVAVNRAKSGVFPGLCPAAGQEGAATVDPERASAALEGVGARPETTDSTRISRIRIRFYTTFGDKISWGGKCELNWFLLTAVGASVWNGRGPRPPTGGDPPRKNTPGHWRS